MPDTSNKNAEIKKQNEAPKKHSFFGGEINAKAKDLLDFRYNTQEEIDKLNEEMIATDDLDKIMKENNQSDNIKNQDEEFIRGNDEKEAESSLEENLQGFKNSQIDNIENNDYNEIYGKEESEPIEGEVIENIDSDENITNDEDNKDEEKTNENSGEDNNNSTKNNVKFFDPFEENLDNNEENIRYVDDENTQGNDDIFDPFDKHNNDDEIEDNNEGDIEENNENIEKDTGDNNDKNNSEELVDDENEKIVDDENEKFVDDENEEIVDDENEEIVDNENEKIVDDENEELVDDENEEIIDDENEEIVDDENEEIVDDENEEIVDDENEEIVDNENEELVDDENEELVDDENEEIVDDENEEIVDDENEELVDDENEELVDDENEEIVDDENEITEQTEINIPIDTNENKVSKKRESKKIKRNPTTGEIITDDEIQLEQGQDTPNSEDDEEYQPSAEEIFEREPEFFADDEISQQFMELVLNVRGIFKLERKSGEQNPYFKILGGKSSDSTLEYLFYLIEEENEPIDLYIKKVEINNENGEENEHLVQFSYNEDKELNIFVDEIILYERINKADSDTSEYNDTKAILEKFIFLTNTYYDELKIKYEEERKEKQKKKQLQQIFKGF